MFSTNKSPIPYPLSFFSFVSQVHPDFWSEYSSSAGVYSVGEVFNGNPQYTSQYQGPLDATLNYPMYYKLYNAFQKKQSLRNLHDGVTAVSYTITYIQASSKCELEWVICCLLLMNLTDFFLVLDVVRIAE